MPLLIGLLTAAAFLLRLSQMHQSLFADETLALREIVGHTLLGTVRTVRSGVESTPPLFFVLAWISAKLGDPTVWIRLPSLILSTATIPIVYLLGRETVGRAAGVLGAAVIAASPFATYYGVEARPYATLAFFVAVSTLGLVLGVRTGRRRWWALYAVAAAAAAYTHYTAIFVLATQGSWSLWACRNRLREPLVANLLAAVLYAPWLPQLHGSYLGVYALLEPLTAANILRDLGQPIAGYPYASLRAIPTVVGLITIGACALTGLAAILVRARGRLRAVLREGLRQGDPRWLLAMLTVATPVGLLLYSLLGTDIWGSRSLYASAPAGVLVLAALLMAIPRSVRPIAIAVTLGLLVFGTIRAISPRYARPPFRAAAQFLDRVAGPRDPVVMYPSSLNLTRAIPAQFSRVHPVLWGVPKQWPAVPAGGSLYVVYDNAAGKQERIPVPRPPNFALVSHRHYSGLLPFTVFRYRAL